MSYLRIGSGYNGSPALEITTTENQEIIPSSPPEWTVGYKFYKFSFMNDQDCTVRINGDEPIFLRAYQGFNCNQHDEGISSFVIVESGINFNWIGAR